MRELSSVRAVRDALTAPPLAGVCTGASRAVIERLDELARRVTGRETPADHAEFLRLMGGAPPPVASPATPTPRRPR